MKVTRLRFQKWKIVTYSTIAIAIMFALILLIHGIDEQGMRVEIRATARTSCILFVGTFIASALHRILSNRITTWLVKNRPYLGISFAISHVFHALAIIGLIVVTSGEAYKSDLGGNLGYLFIVAITATWFNPTASWMGERACQILQAVGMYYLWLAFTYAFSLKLDQSLFIYLPFFISLVLAMVLRLIALAIPRKPKLD
jgi:methionine sulfoxide reductase heme-binding subunit